jgi:dihydrofolate reductase
MDGYTVSTVPTIYSRKGAPSNFFLNVLYPRYPSQTQPYKGDPLNYIKIHHGPYMGEERKVILHIATSKDGFIATLDDGLDWLPGPEGDEDYGLGEFMETIDCVLIGRRTWDVISQFEEEPFSNFERHILSRKTHSAVDLIHDLKIKSGEHIWLLGGGVLNGECLQAEVIDEIIITRFPIELETGIPVFGKYGIDLPDSWEKKSETKFAGDVTQLIWKPFVSVN